MSRAAASRTGRGGINKRFMDRRDWHCYETPVHETLVKVPAPSVRETLVKCGKAGRNLGETSPR